MERPRIKTYKETRSDLLEALADLWEDKLSEHSRDFKDPETGNWVKGDGEPINNEGD